LDDISPRVYCHGEIIDLGDDWFDIGKWLEHEIRTYFPHEFRSEPMPDTNPVIPTVDLTTLTIDQLNDYRHELTLSIREPGTDFDPDDEAQQKVYLDQIEAIKARLEVLGYTG
jgi:hypothetical protein